MPHLELSYSGNLKIDTKGIMREVEALILRHDSSAGETKGRAYPTSDFHHTHLKAAISMLAKPNRDANFVALLQDDIFNLIASALPRPCWLSVDISFSDQSYRTEVLK